MLHTLLVMALVLVGVGLVLAIIYAALKQVPFLQEYLWAVRAIFLIIIGLVLVDFLFGGTGALCGGGGITDFHLTR